MKLTASDYDKLTRFFRDETQLSFRPGKRLLAWLLEHFDVRVSNNIVKLDATTKAEIRAYLEQQNPNFDAKAGLPQQADHMTMSKTLRDEKLGSIKPNDNVVLVKSMTAKISFVTGKVDLGPEISYRVNVNQISLESYDTLLVVENLDVFDQLPQFQIPINGKILLVYRGHDKGTSNGLKTLLEQAASHCMICWFPDLDPKGLELALAEKTVNQILSVDTQTDISQLTALNNVEKYMAQSQSVKSLVSCAHGEHPLVSFLLEHKLAIMQQHILTQQLPLRSYQKQSRLKTEL